MTEYEQRFGCVPLILTSLITNTKNSSFLRSIICSRVFLFLLPEIAQLSFFILFRRIKFFDFDSTINQVVSDTEKH